MKIWLVMFLPRQFVPIASLWQTRRRLHDAISRNDRSNNTHHTLWVRDHWTCYLNKQKIYYIDTCDTNISIRLRFAWALISFSLPLSFYLINVINSRCCGRWTMPMSAFWQLQIPIDLVVPSLVLAAWLQRCRFYFNATCQRSVYTRDAHCTPNEWVYRYD